LALIPLITGPSAGDPSTDCHYTRNEEAYKRFIRLKGAGRNIRMGKEKHYHVACAPCFLRFSCDPYFYFDLGENKGRGLEIRSNVNLGRLWYRFGCFSVQNGAKKR
jgi:hypothetical protein